MIFTQVINLGYTPSIFNRAMVVVFNHRQPQITENNKHLDLT